MKDTRTTVYFCHVCSYRSNNRNDFASHMKHTNHNNKFSYNCRNCICIAIKKQEIQKKKILNTKRIIYIEEKDECDELSDKIKNMQLKT